MLKSSLSIPARRSASTVGTAAEIINVADLRRRSLVIAPHQDDETLGCGGTFIRKKQLGAETRVVFMTDGSLSHAHLIEPKKLSAIRRDEAFAACAAMGIEASAVEFLDYPEGFLHDHIEHAVSRVASILDQWQPKDIFVPYRYDVHPDHTATNRILRKALQTDRRPYRIYEYPIWAWHHWPLVRLPLNFRRTSLRLIKHTLLGRFGYTLRRDCTHAVDISDVLDRKREVLSLHASQTTRLIPDSGWSVLADVADGEFLKCFEQRFEFFRRYDVCVKG